MMIRLLLIFLFVSSIAHAEPTVRAVGTVSSNVNQCSPGLPTGTAAGDLLIMFCETANQAISATGSGWTALEQSGSGTAGASTATRLSIMYLVADGTDATDTNIAIFDHCACRIVGVTEGTYDSSTPFDSGNIAKNCNTSANTSVSILGSSTTNNDSLVFASAAQDTPDSNTGTEFSGEANTDLSSPTERIDNSRAAGNGGALYVVTGIDTTAGSYGATTATSVTDPDRRCHITFAVNPATSTTQVMLIE